MIMQAPTPYVPQRRLSVPTPQNNFHLRQPRKRRQGMGDVCVSGPYGSDANGPLCLDQTTGSPINCNDARCSPGGSGGSSSAGSNSATFIQAPTPVFATMPFGNSTTTTFTLESYLQQLVQQFTGQSVLSLVNQGITSPSQIPAAFLAEAQSYCAVENPPDCNNMSALAQQYGAQAAMAFANVPASQWNPSTFTAYAIPGAPAQTGGVVSSPGPSAAQQALQTGTPPVTPAPVTNPPAAQSNTVNQTTVGSGAGQSNSSNPLSVLPDLSTLPTWAYWAAGGVVALLVISSLGKR